MVKRFNSLEELNVEVKKLLNQRIPRAANQAASKLVKIGEAKVKSTIVQSKVTFTGHLENSVQSGSNMQGGKHVVYANATYASDIETGIPSNPGLQTFPDIERWRRQKRVYSRAHPNEVEVGKSGGGSRKENVPFPKGVWMFKKGAMEIQKNVIPELVKQLTKLK